MNIHTQAARLHRGVGFGKRRGLLHSLDLKYEYAAKLAVIAERPGGYEVARSGHLAYVRHVRFLYLFGFGRARRSPFRPAPQKGKIIASRAPVITRCWRLGKARGRERGEDN
jgi:hypothetical protein